jgi:hypothetical protein
MCVSSFRICRFFLAGLLLVFFLGGSVIAQTQFGQISGKVVDPSEAVIAGAKVTVTKVDTLTREVTETNAEGLFLVGNVAVGEYDVAVEKEGFNRAIHRVKVEVAQRVFLPFTLKVGTVAEKVEVVGGAAITVNTVSAELSRELTSTEITNLPLLTRNPYALMELAPGAVNANVATGDNSNTLGISVSGTRTRSINFLLDGSENNETFGTGPSTLVPVDAIQEFKLQTNNMTAEFGRNALQANVATRSGSNNFHGALSEFYRGAALSSQPVEEKVNRIAKGNYVRNVFGAALGGPIIKDRTFFYGAFEGTRVRSVGRSFYYVPTQQFAANASPNMNDYLQAAGGLPAPLLPQVLTASDITATETADGGAYGSDAAHSLFTSGTTNLIPATTPLWQRTYTSVPIDAGGGPAQNAWSVFGRIDHQISDRTNLTGRYAWYRQLLPVGASSNSPFSLFDTDYSFRSQNATLILTHAFTPQLFNESRFSYSRTEPNAPLGKGSVNVMCETYGYSGSMGTGDQMVLGGYLPSACFGYAIPSGGPQNTYSLYSGFSYPKGRHVFKWGGYFRHLRDNHTFGAFANAYAQSSTMQNLLDGYIDADFRLAFNPRGKVPGDSYDIAVDGPIESPSFTRHYRYNEFAFYGEDSFRLRPDLTLTAGLRWEYFGVLHSPDGERQLDDNLYLGTRGSVFQQIADAGFGQTNNFFNQNFTNFAPRVALAWNIGGDARTVVRAGYGIFYDANFGNALFNVIQNPPSYAVVQTAGGPVLPNQFDTLSAMLGAAGGSFTYRSSARMLNKDMFTARTQQWNATVEHDILGKGIFASIAYVGAKGDKLYSLNNLNQQGSCIFLGSSYCAGNDFRRLNLGVTGMNRRANEGWSRYHSMQLELKAREISRTGLQLNTNYTWAHSIDNATSFFNDSAFDTNGGFGFRDPYNPSADKGNSSNDIRHRFAMNYSWEIPWLRDLKGTAGTILGGWTLTGIWTAQTGGAFTVYEDAFVYDDQCSASGANSCYPVVVGPQARQQNGSTFIGPNRAVLYDFSGSLMSLADYCRGNTACSQNLYFSQPNGLYLNRNTFRTPGYWNFDAAILKSFKLPREDMRIQFRAEFFNLFNHSNLYADPNTNLLSAGQVLARRGVPPSHELYNVPFDRRNIQLGIRFQF